MGCRIGIIAGKGKITELSIYEAKNLGFFTAVAGIKNFTNSKLERIADKFLWIEPNEIEKLINFFKIYKINDLVLIGKIDYSMIYKLKNKRELISNLANRLNVNLNDRKPYSLFLLLNNYLKNFNFKIKSIKLLLKRYLPDEKIFTGKMPSKKIIDDIIFGWKIAKKIASLDIGQTVIVKEKAVIAIEGMEGTDETIIRAGKLAGEGVVVIKVGKPIQDMRFDVPVVGFSTLKKIAQIKGKCLCIEAGKTIFLDQKKCILFAKKNNISLIAIKQKSDLLRGKI